MVSRPRNADQTTPPTSDPRGRWWHDLRRDVPFALRTLGRSPGFAILATITIALGIGANAAVFSVVDTVLLRPLPYAQPDRLVRLWESHLDDPKWLGSVSPANAIDWRGQNRTFEQLVPYTSGGMAFRAGDKVEYVNALASWPELFTMTGSTAMIGRTFSADENESGKHRVVVLSEGFWKRAFGGRRDVIGESVTLDGEPYTVIGVMPPRFTFPPGSSRTDLWRPFELAADAVTQRGNHWLSVVGRLRPGVTLDQAQADLRRVADGLRVQYSAEMANRGVGMRPLQDAVTGRVRPALRFLLAAVALVLCIACANVANLQLARAAARQREIAVRLAIGAGRGQLLRQFLVESILLALGGALLAVLLAKWALAAMQGALARALPTTEPIALDLRVFLVLLVVALACGVLFGLAPGLYASPKRLRDELTGVGTKSTSTRHQQRFRHGLVVTQVAMSMLLLIGAGLLMRAFLALRSTSSGMVTEGVMTMRLAPVAVGDSAIARLATRFYRPLLERVRALPGVTSAGTINILPIDSWGYNGPYWVDGGLRPERGKEWSMEHREVSPGYFATMGIPILQGRDLTDRDATGADQPILVNDAVVKQAFPDGRAVGERIRRWDGEGGVFTIVGVVGSVRQASLDREPLPEMYMASGGQFGGTEQTLVVKSAIPPATLLPLLREQIRAVDPYVPVYDIQSMDQVVSQSLGARRLSLTLVGAFAALALILAASGLYGVIAFLVAQRIPELGVRMALGADRGRILRLVLGQGARLAGAGIVIGLAGALAFSRLMAGLLYGVSVRDTLTFSGALVSLGVTAILASLVPALRAARTTPLVALRSD